MLRLDAGDRHRMFLVGGRVSAAGISAVWMVIAARSLEIVEFADLALGSALCAMAVQVADVGVGIQLPQAFAVRGEGMPVTAIRQAFLRRTAGSLVAAPLLVLAFVAVAADPSFAVAGGFAVSTIATALCAVGHVALRSVDRYTVETVLEPVGRVAVLGFGTYAAVSGRGLVWIAWSYAFADLMCLGVVAVVVSRGCSPSAGGPRLGPVTWLAAAGPIGMVYWRADVWLLAALASSRQVALYGSSYRLLDAALLPALVLSQLFIAPFARCPRDDQRVFALRWARRSVALMLPFTVTAVLLGSSLLRLLFGEEFAGAGATLGLLGIAAPLTAAAFVLTTALATLAPRAYISVAVLALALNIGGNLLLLPHFGASGAAAMTVVSQGALVFTLWRTISRRLPSTGAPLRCVTSRTVPT